MELVNVMNIHHHQVWPRRRWVASALAILIALAIALDTATLTLVLSSVARLEKELRELQGTVSLDVVQKGLCVPCSLLRLGNPEEDEALRLLDRYGEEVSEECCATNRDQFETLFFMVGVSRNRSRTFRTP